MKIKTLLIVLTVMLFTASTSFANEIKFVVGSPNYILNGITIESDASPFISSEGRTMVPLRSFSNALNIRDDQMMWVAQKQAIIIFRGSQIIEFVIGDSKFTINDIPYDLDSPALILDGRTYIPLRAAAMAFETSIKWDAMTNTISLTYDETQSIDKVEETVVRNADDLEAYLDDRYGILETELDSWQIKHLVSEYDHEGAKAAGYSISSYFTYYDERDHYGPAHVITLGLYTKDQQRNGSVTLS